MVICLEQGAYLHMALLIPLSLASVKSRLVLLFWYRLTRVVPEKGPLNGCVYIQRHTDNATASSAVGRIYAVHAMRLNNFVIHALISLQHFMALNADEHSYPVGSDCLVKPPVKLFTVGSRKPSCSLLLVSHE